MRAESAGAAPVRTAIDDSARNNCRFATQQLLIRRGG
jgi:hypothetical protein